MISGYSSDHDDVVLIGQSLVAPTGATLQATAPKTGGGTYTPPSGALNWLRMEGQNFVDVGHNSNYLDELTLGYTVQHAFLMDATLGSAETGRIFEMKVREADGSGLTWFNLEWVYVSSTEFNLRLTQGSGRTQIGSDGGTTFTTKDWVSWRLELDGITATLWATKNAVVSTASTYEFVAAETRHFYTRAMLCRAADDIGAGEYIYHDACATIEADSTADRPDSDIVGNRVDVGATGDQTGYGDDSNCNAGQAGGVYTDVLIGNVTADQVDAATFVCENGSEADSFSADCASYSITGKLRGVGVRGAGESNTGGKTVDTTTSLSIDDETTYDDFTNNNMNWTGGLRGMVACYEKAPDGGEWEDESGSLTFVIKLTSDSGNGANDEWAALGVWAFEVSTDAPPADLPERSYPRGTGRGIRRGIA